MNKLFIVVLFCNFLFPCALSAQKYANSQFVVFSYSYRIDEKVRSELGSLSKYIEHAVSNNQNKLDAMLVHSIYDILTQTFADSLKVFFLPPTSLTNKAKYNDYGYPEINIQRAIRLSDTKYFLRIGVSLENNKYDETGKKNINNLFLPIIKISVDIFNKFGYNPIQSSESQAHARVPVVVGPEFIAGLKFVAENVKPAKEGETLRELIEKAVIEALNVIRNKKQR